MTNPTVTVLQVDRDAAGDFARDFSLNHPLFHEEIRSGEHDLHPVVQSYARHRIAAEQASQPTSDAMREVMIEECAKICDEELVPIYEDSPNETDRVCNEIVRHIAANIRALAQEKPDAV